MSDLSREQAIELARKHYLGGTLLGSDGWIVSAIQAAYRLALESRGGEPVAWRVYFPDEQREEIVSDLDDLVDDLTNCRHHEPEPLYTSPPDSPRPGWVLVPEEPTPEMEQYICDCDSRSAPGLTYREYWKALLSARPQPPAEPKPKMRATPTSSRHDDGLEA